ncbi:MULTISPECIES: hypothetical protein [Pseudomonadati]|uniref:hypothetical protein n=1 Tax=unclassified Halobacteriovorax TaxID=2639665 RepID=UPI000CD2C391|nr:hypothetical protein [Halobacteriovorax sp. DA5]POB14355.1 hypothetical protein C0Z22_04485 [Halobacteriovorax sp. DA5]
MGIKNKFVNFFTRINKNRLSNDDSRDKLLKSMQESLQSPVRICLAHNVFEKTPLRDDRKNLHDIYLHVESNDHNLLLHFDQMNILNLVDKEFIEYQNEVENFDAKKFEQYAVKAMIDGSIENLKSIPPKTGLNEDKSLEWLKVTLLTLKKSLARIDHRNTILSYKVFFGQWEQSPILRVMIYNLDIKLIFNKDQLKLEVKNKENRAEFDSQAKKYEASFGQLHNDVLNEIINLFVSLKQSVS